MIASHHYSKAIRAFYADKLDKDFWGYDHVYEPDDNANYDNYFASVLPEGSFSELLNQRRLAGRGTDVLEVFGSAAFVSPGETRSLTGMRIESRELEGQDADPEGRREIIPGNAFASGTLLALQGSMAKRDIQNFDVIVIRPIQGLLSANATKDLFPDEAAWEAGTLWYLLYQLNRFYRHLSPDHGELILEEKLWLNDIPRFSTWVRRLQLVPTLSVRRGKSTFANGVLRITRFPHSPAGLSDFSDVVLPSSPDDLDLSVHDPATRR